MRILESGNGGGDAERRVGRGPGVGRTRNSPGWALCVSINDQSTGTPMDEATEGKRGGGGSGGKVEMVAAEKEEEVETEDDVGVGSTRDERTARWWVKMGM